MAHETYTLPPTPAPRNHGRTGASWALVSLVLLGTLIVAAGLTSGNADVWIAGLVVLAGGVAASLAMRALGHGQPVVVRPRVDWYGDPAA